MGDIRACVFDAYGTLFDFASATRGCRDLLGDYLDALTALGAKSSFNTPGYARYRGSMSISGRSLEMRSISRWRR
jgi:FMN phosphatase YigB (HAD superfamily)